MARNLQVFISYSSEDEESVRSLYQRLHSEGGFDLWFDREKLLPGQNVRFEIENAVDEADAVLICLSRTSITKEGFVQRELQYTLDRAEEKPEGTIFLIPTKLEPCDVPRRLKQWHWVDLSREGGYQRLLRSLSKRAEDLGICIQSSARKHIEGTSLEPISFIENIPVKLKGKSQKTEFTPDKTMSNPHYESDVEALEKRDYDLSAVLGHDTIVLVVGAGTGAELCDRPIAELLRDEIDKHGESREFRRGIVVTDVEFLQNTKFERQPAIAVGGPRSNSLARHIETNASPASISSFENKSRAFLPGPPPRIALWGFGARETRRCVQEYLEQMEGLSEFLKMCWR